MKRRYDVVVIGAGPAGMAAATTCASAGASLLLLDEQDAPGGQVYRSIEQPGLMDRDVLGPDYYKGEALVQSLRCSQVEYVPSATVWQVSPEREIAFSVNGVSQVVSARQVILATGAQERPFPIQGWTLPGVMNVGAAQILLKQSGMVGEGAVFAGTGPLLYLTARQYIRAGATVTAVLDTTPISNYWRALARGFDGLSGWESLRKGLQWKREIRAAGVPIVEAVTGLRVRGDRCVRGIDYCQHGRWLHLSTDHVFLHQGVVPNINLTQSMRCAHEWFPRQLCWRVVTDAWGRTSLPGVAVAGDAADIGGAACAPHRGVIAALGALQQLGRISNEDGDAIAAAHRQALAREERFRRFLDQLFQPSESFLVPRSADVLVCRCEEISAGRLREVIAIGCEGPNHLKSYTRCGMGPCQGRMCGLTVTQVLAAELDRPPAAIGYYRLRQPIKPIGLGELAALAQVEAPAPVACRSKVGAS